MQSARLSHAESKMAMAAILQAANDALHEQAEQFNAFREQSQRLAQNIRNNSNKEDSRIYAARLIDLGQTFNDAWAKAQERFRAYISAL
jgi:ABC-type transporter Mla subunit MlaD